MTDPTSELRRARRDFAQSLDRFHIAVLLYATGSDQAQSREDIAKMGSEFHTAYRRFMDVLAKAVQAGPKKEAAANDGEPT